METERVESNKLPDAPQVFQESPEEEPIVDASKNPGWRAIFREAFNKARREQKPTTTRRDLGKDRSKSLILVVGGGVLLLFLFFGVFSSPNKPTGPGNLKRPGTPNLGRKETPGQGASEAGKSVTPLLSADLRSPDGARSSDLTADDIDKTARVRATTPNQITPSNSQAQTAKIVPPYARQYALSQINVPESALPPSSPTALTSDDLRKPSLVFVRGLSPPRAMRHMHRLSLSSSTTTSKMERLLSRLERKRLGSWSR